MSETPKTVLAFGRGGFTCDYLLALEKVCDWDQRPVIAEVFTSLWDRYEYDVTIDPKTIHIKYSRMRGFRRKLVEEYVCLRVANANSLEEALTWMSALMRARFVAVEYPAPTTEAGH